MAASPAAARAWLEKHCFPGGNWFADFFLYPTDPQVVFQYDALNRLTKMVDGLGTNQYAYTAGGELWTEGGVFASDTVTNGYINRKRVSLAFRQPTGEWTNGFAYDGAGRLTNVTSQAGSFGYGFRAGLASRLPVSMALPNSSVITNAYDPVARLTATFLRTSGGTDLDSAQYGYNAAGQRTAFTNAAGTYVQYSYDAIGQLKVAASSVSSENRGYAYDAAWNLNWLTNNGAASQFKVDVKNELTNWPDGGCGSDANGNLTNKPMDLSGDELVYTYDDENRLVDVKNLAVAFETVFVYDGLGRLRLREEYTGSGSVGGGGAAVPAVSSGLTLAYEIRYLYDGLRVIQERDSNNVPLVSYTRGTDLSGTLEGAGGIGGLLARSYGYSGGNWSTHDFYHADGNGNITYLETSAQGLAASYRYDAYGNTLSSSGSLAATNVYRFSSKEIHANSGMYYYLYRFYDPSTQRWVNRDLLSEPGFEVVRNSAPMPFLRFLPPGEVLQGPNLYAYTRNDPADKYDPLGLALPGYIPPRGAPPCFNPKQPCSRSKCREQCFAIVCGPCGIGAIFFPPSGPPCAVACIACNYACFGCTAP